MRESWSSYNWRLCFKKRKTKISFLWKFYKTTIPCKPVARTFPRQKKDPESSPLLAAKLLCLCQTTLRYSLPTNHSLIFKWNSSRLNDRPCFLFNSKSVHSHLWFIIYWLRIPKLLSSIQTSSSIWVKHSARCLTFLYISVSNLDYSKWSHDISAQTIFHSSVFQWIALPWTLLHVSHN